MWRVKRSNFDHIAVKQTEMLYFAFKRILVLNWGENKNNQNLTFYAEVTKFTVMPSNLASMKKIWPMAEVHTIDFLDKSANSINLAVFITWFFGLIQ